MSAGKGQTEEKRKEYEGKSEEWIAGADWAREYAQLSDDTTAQILESLDMQVRSLERENAELTRQLYCAQDDAKLATMSRDGWREDAEKLRAELAEAKRERDEKEFTLQNTFNHWQMAMRERDELRAEVEQAKANGAECAVDYLKLRAALERIATGADLSTEADKTAHVVMLASVVQVARQALEGKE
jgi:chromosome segregation ATPase